MATDVSPLPLDGATLARRMLDETARRAGAFASQAGRRVCLAAVLVGDDPASVTYVGMKRRRCERAGIESRLVHLSTDVSTSEVVGVVEALSDDPTVDGILVQHPVPDQVDERAVFEAIVPAKDVDGVTMESFAAMAFDLPGHRSCTPGHPPPPRRIRHRASWPPRRGHRAKSDPG